ncbi:MULTISPECIES: C-3',4' desaturase CrtD [Prochlorococcus]|uniref:C-3',4' desaturase CrtD n=1 Tax=Prochlorococcus TaxID=1218 RepID=UPI0005337260|nr:MULTISPECIES: C-3',4' desaturase CrtD [Prochlorococcus]KGG13589.1 Neurosporene desaturase [Prochlorococcus sp. MIT 0601]
MTNEQVIVIGGGIAGLTASALLASEGIDVILLESHFQTGGCAGTFKRGKYVFDVGATQVAGLEEGGIHERVFRHLKYPLPYGEILDPGCLVDLGDGTTPIYLWHQPLKWKEERKKQFPGSEKFWSLCSFLHQSNWDFAKQDAVLPIANAWDIKESLKALRFTTLLSGLVIGLSVADLLWLCSCHKDYRLKKFLDLQLQLYSQETSERTAALYGATVLQMAQAPLGLWHLQGSMQKLSDALEACLLRDGGQLRLKHKVVGLIPATESQPWIVDVIDHTGSTVQLTAKDVVFSLPPQSLLQLIKNHTSIPKRYLQRLEQLPKPTGAMVFYGAIAREHLQEICANHLQIYSSEIGSLFCSISLDGDGRAPIGEATFIASAFTKVSLWNGLDENAYLYKKELFLTQILRLLNSSLNISPDKWLHKELATPRSFAKWTGRPEGIVGGLGQNLDSFGPFGLPSRSQLNGLWLCGDSIYPGEGTAGVTQSALMACRQLLASRGGNLIVPQ